jgi:hypothetical protein
VDQARLYSECNAQESKNLINRPIFGNLVVLLFELAMGRRFLLMKDVKATLGISGSKRKA